MDEPCDPDLLEALRGYLGPDRFHSFAHAFERLSQRKRSSLYFWQEAAVEGFTKATGFEICRSHPRLSELFRGVIQHGTLTPEELPRGVHIQSLEGYCPVQGLGTCDGMQWCFRARHDEWSIGVSDGTADPVDIGPWNPTSFYYAETYGDAIYTNVGWMPLPEARYLISRGLERYRAWRTPA